MAENKNETTISVSHTTKKLFLDCKEYGELADDTLKRIIKESKKHT